MKSAITVLSHTIIAGQTAPGDGITLKNGQLAFKGTQIIMRYFRVRLGDQSGRPPMRSMAPSDVGGWPELKSLPAPVDSDHDGMPDDWEKANGLNPEDPKDRNQTYGPGYTMLEKCINGLVSF